MTRGNQRELARAKAAKREAEKNKAHSTLKDKSKALTITCQVCRQTFMCTSSEQILGQHVTNKHDKKTFHDCFPGWTPAK